MSESTWWENKYKSRKGPRLIIFKLIDKTFNFGAPSRIRQGSIRGYLGVPKETKNIPHAVDDRGWTAKFAQKKFQSRKANSDASDGRLPVSTVLEDFWIVVIFGQRILACFFMLWNYARRIDFSSFSSSRWISRIPIHFHLIFLLARIYINYCWAV